MSIVTAPKSDAHIAVNSAVNSVIDCQAKTPVKSVKEANIDVRENKLIFVFKAQSFLYQQIRIMVGTLLEIGQNNQKPEWIEELFLSKNRSLAGPTMPSKGLILKGIQY